MVDTIQEALKLFHLVTFLFGFGILRYPLNYTRVWLSILYILSVWSIYVYVFYYAFTISMERMPDFIIYFMAIINLFMTMISIIVNICKHKKFNILIYKLGQVDDTLEELGTPKEYRKIRNFTKWLIIMWLIMICIIWANNSMSLTEIERPFNNTAAIVISFTFNYAMYINILIDIIFMFLLRYIDTRYDEINNYIRQLSETEECGVTMRCIWKSSLVTHYYIRSPENRKRILWITMHLHSQLCRIALNINDLFKMQMTIQTVAYFISLTSLFYIQYYIILCLAYKGGEIRWNILLSTNIWCFIIIIRLISFNCICESVSDKAQKTEDIIHKLTNFICFTKAREEIFQFILQITLRPLKFTGMGLFYFGYTFLFKFFIWIFSIVIFIIQMDTSPMYRTIFNKDNVTCYF